MTPPEPCSEASQRAGEDLAGTATEASRWLVVERHGAWGRDAIQDTDLPGAVRAVLAAFPGRALLIRSPGASASGATVFEAEAREGGGTLVRRELARLDDLAAEEGSGAREPVAGPLVLVCGHGRRDACCARLGVPVFDALAAHVRPGLLWQSSHQGGHRFAANVLALPDGIQLGRVRPPDAPRVASLLRRGRIPLGLYRGRAIYPPRAQAAEIRVRLLLGIDHVDALWLVAGGEQEVTFGYRGGEITALVEETAGPAVPPSCGNEPEATARYLVSL